MSFPWQPAVSHPGGLGDGASACRAGSVVEWWPKSITTRILSFRIPDANPRRGLTHMSRKREFGVNGWSDGCGGTELSNSIDCERRCRIDAPLTLMFSSTGRCTDKQLRGGDVAELAPPLRGKGVTPLTPRRRACVRSGERGLVGVSSRFPTKLLASAEPRRQGQTRRLQPRRSSSWK